MTAAELPDVTTAAPAGGPRYAPHIGNHVGADLVCLDCGVLVVEQAAHTRFHSILSAHAWALAVLQTSHIGPAVHDRYTVLERIRSKQFDSWSGDALAEVIAGLPEGDPDDA